MSKFSSRYIKIAKDTAESVSHLWLKGMLRKNTVRQEVRKIVSDSNISFKLDSGAYRTALILPSGVIKIPHHEDAIKSTVIEARLFHTVRKNRGIALHFPHTEVVHAYGMPVMIQERVPFVAAQEVSVDHPLSGSDLDDAEYHPAHIAVDKFARKLGLGDAHLGNYGWRSNSKGFYPVFFDCEVSTGMSDLTPTQIQRVSEKDIRWNYPV